MPPCPRCLPDPLFPRKCSTPGPHSSSPETILSKGRYAELLAGNRPFTLPLLTFNLILCHHLTLAFPPHRYSKTILSKSRYAELLADDRPFALLTPRLHTSSPPHGKSPSTLLLAPTCTLPLHRYSKTILSKGRYAELLADNRPFTDEELELFDRAAEHAYESFRNKAAESRGMSVETMQEVAQVRYPTGVGAGGWKKEGKLL